MQNSNLKGIFIVQTILFFVAIVLIAGGAYYAGTKNTEVVIKNNETIPSQQDVSTTPIENKNSTATSILTYWDAKNKFSFQYPSNLTLSKDGDAIIVSHTIPFDNYDAGCDMKGDAPLSKTLNDLNLKIYVVSENSLSIPSYAEDYRSGVMKGKKAYIGAEGCGKTTYYFPISGNRTLVIDKAELQVLSAVVTPEVRSRVLSVPGVISQEEGNKIVEEIIESFYIDPAILKTVKSTSQVSSYGTQGSCGFDISSPIANSKVKFPLTISGTVDNSNYEELGCRWIISEGQAATAQLFYNYKNQGWSAVDVAVPIKFTGFNNSKATFSTKISLKSGMDIEIGAGTPMKIVFTDVNEMDGSVTNTFELPINFTY